MGATGRARWERGSATSAPSAWTPGARSTSSSIRAGCTGSSRTSKSAVQAIPPLGFWLTGAAIAVLAFALRVLVHAGRTPGGVDTWYYLAYADAFRRRPSLDVRLPQYLLQDERQSYPPLFPSLLSLIPAGVLRRWYW